MSMEEALKQSLQRHIDLINEGRETALDGDGKPAGWLVAQTDQFGAESSSILEEFVKAAVAHRAEGQRCCENMTDCVGIEVMLAIATLAEVSLSHALGAFTQAVGKLAQHEQG